MDLWVGGLASGLAAGRIGTRGTDVASGEGWGRAFGKGSNCLREGEGGEAARETQWGRGEVLRSVLVYYVGLCD